MTDMNCSKLNVEAQINGKMICDECLANTGAAGYFMMNKSQ